MPRANNQNIFIKTGKTSFYIFFFGDNMHFSKTLKYIFLNISILFLAVLHGCGGTSSQDNNDDTPDRIVNSETAFSLYNQNNINAGEAGCPNGGIEVSTGFDNNANGALDENEITDTQALCHGTPGNLWQIEASSVEASQECPAGGKKLSIGLDGNSDSQLTNDEITQVQFLCNGLTGSSSLIDLLDESAGENCSAGGQQIIVGLDANSNGHIDEIEIQKRKYICHGASTTSSAGALLMDIADDISHDECTLGGKRFKLGHDANSNGILDANEVTSSDMLCVNNSAPRIRPWEFYAPDFGEIHITGYRGHSLQDIHWPEIYNVVDYDGDDITLRLDNAPTWLSAELVTKEIECDFFNDPFCSAYSTPELVFKGTPSENEELQFSLVLDDGSQSVSYPVRFIPVQGNELTITANSSVTEGIDQYAVIKFETETPLTDNIEISMSGWGGDYYSFKYQICDEPEMLNCTNTEGYSQTLEMGEGEQVKYIIIEIIDDDFYTDKQLASTIHRIRQPENSHVFIKKSNTSIEINVEEDEEIPSIGFRETSISLTPSTGYGIDFLLESDVGIRYTTVAYTVSTSLIVGEDISFSRDEFYFYNGFSSDNLWIYPSDTLFETIDEPTNIIIEIQPGEGYQLAEGKNRLTITVADQDPGPTPAQTYGVQINDISASPSSTMLTGIHSTNSDTLFAFGMVEGTIDGQTYLGGTRDIWFSELNTNLRSQKVYQLGTENFDSLSAYAVTNDGRVYLLYESEIANQVTNHLIAIDENGATFLDTTVAFGSQASRSPSNTQISIDNNGDIYILTNEYCCAPDGEGIDGDDYHDGFSLQKLSQTGERLWFQDDISNVETHFRTWDSDTKKLGILSDGTPILALAGHPNSSSADLEWVGNDDWIVSKVNPTNGEITSSQIFGSINTDILQEMKIYDDRIYLAGRSSAAFDGLNHILEEDIVMLALDSELQKVFSKQFGTHKHDITYQLIINDNHIYLLSEFDGEYNGLFNSKQILRLDHQGEETAFVEISSNFEIGNESFYLNYQQNGHLALDGSGNLYLTGQHHSFIRNNWGARKFNEDLEMQ